MELFFNSVINFINLILYKSKLLFTKKYKTWLKNYLNNIY